MAAVVTHRDLAPQHIRTLIPEGESIDSAIYCSVRRNDPARVMEILSEFTSSVTILSANTRLPITIDYRSPGTLGPDRIAAAVGATVVEPHHTCLVVDMGTAITYDGVGLGTLCGRQHSSRHIHEARSPEPLHLGPSRW